MSSAPAYTALKWLGLQSYEPVWHAMREWTDRRESGTADQLWCLEHKPVYTLGRAGKHEHVMGPLDADLVESDRGGQVTYHGPGQLVVYTLVDIARLQLSVRGLVQGLESAVIGLLAELGVEGARWPGAPGVYVNGAKVAALGLRVRRGRAFHGLSLNIDMDLSPFARINPCGYQGLAVTQLCDLGVRTTPREVAASICRRLEAELRLAPCDVTGLGECQEQVAV